MLGRDWSSSWSDPLTNDKLNTIKNNTQDAIDEVLRELSNEDNKKEKFQNSGTSEIMEKNTCPCEQNACYKCIKCCKNKCENCIDCPCFQNACSKCNNCKKGACNNCTKSVIKLNVDVMQFILMIFLVILAILQALQLQKIKSNIPIYTGNLSG